MDSDTAEPFDLTPSVDPKELLSTIKAGLKLGTSTVLRPYLLLAGAAVLLALLRPAGSLFQALGVDLGVDALMLVGVVLAWGIGIVAFILTLLISGLQVGLYRAVREVLVEGPERVAEVGAIKVAAERYGIGLASALLLGVMAAVGLLLCILPGIVVALLFGMVPFLSVATDTPFAQTFQRSIKLFTGNLAVMLLLYGGLIVLMTIVVGLSLLITGIGAALGGLIGNLVGVTTTGVVLGQWAAQVVGALIGLPVGYAVFIAVGSTFALVEARDAGVALKGAEGLVV